MEPRASTTASPLPVQRSGHERSAEPTAPAGDPGTYQTFLRVRSDGDLVKRVEEQLEDWLRTKKGWDPPTEESGFHRGPGDRELLILHRPVRTGRDFRARLRERNRSTGTWTTTLTVHESRTDPSWIGLHVSNSEGRFVSVPRLASYLVDALEVYDGDTWLSSAPRVVHRAGVEEFAEQLCGLERAGLYLVAGTSEGLDVPFESFRQQVAAWTRETVGLAEVAVLDPAATGIFSEIMGSSHRVEPWTIRTYRPDVDPAVAEDGRRHRILGTGRLATEPDDVVRRMLGRAARRHAAEQPRPERFVPVDRKLTRFEDTLLLDELGVPPVPTPSPEPPAPRTVSVAPPIPAATRPDTSGTDVGEAAERYLAQLELVRSVLGVDDLSAGTLDEVARLLARGRSGGEALDRVRNQLEQRRQRIEDLNGEVSFYREIVDDHEIELADAADRLAKVADENRWLRTRLRGLEDHETAAATLPSGLATDYPADFLELADRLVTGAPPHVVFTGDLKQVRSLVEHDTLGRIAQVAWDALLALSDYVRAREEGVCTHGVKHYLTHTPQGFRTLPPKKFAEKETGTTMRAWGDQREFPVPTNVDSAGTTAMEAHVKLGQVGMVSPRLYYLDDWVHSGRVYVGYIGEHLRNTKTN